MYFRAVGRRFTQMNAYFLVMNSKRCKSVLVYFEFDGNQVLSTRPGRLYLEGRFIGAFFALRFWGAYIWRGVYMEGLIFGILQ